jgi:hypothetical protein
LFLETFSVLLLTTLWTALPPQLSRRVELVARRLVAWRMDPSQTV